MPKLKSIVADLLDMHDPGQAVASVSRSGKWPKVEKAHLKAHPVCEVCGGKKSLNAHHILPYHLYPVHELDPRNLITLCRGEFNCHLLFGHLGDFKGFNPLVRADAAIWRFRLRARKVLLRLAKETIR